jgi:soluble lytic murein transglycosylase-like protein
MRGIGRAFTRFPTVAAFVAGAAILAGAASARGNVQDQPGADDTAMAIPRVASRGGAGVALPQPLLPSEAIRIRQIFVLQARGDVERAERELEAVDRTTPLGEAMLGHILADRYLGQYTRPGAKELRAWLSRWPDLPQARAIHALLVARLPRGAKPPPAPRGIVPLAPLPVTHMPDQDEDSLDDLLARNRELDRALHAAANAGADHARGLLMRTSGLSLAYDAQLRGEAAQILFTAGRDEEAFDIAAAGMHACMHSAETCDTASLAGIVAGLAAWRMHRYETAQSMFEAAWHARTTTPALKAKAAFWAARTHLRSGNAAAYVAWMSRASAERDTFYGLLARRSLGHGASPLADGTRETLSEADVDAVAATPQGLRAFALLQVGQAEHAEAELRGLWPTARNTPLARAVMLVADNAGLWELAAQLADLLEARDGAQRAATRFAMPRLRPDTGFTVDPALVYGITRVESDFHSAMVSTEGARGLMQIMPDTASFIVGRPDSASLRRSLHDPGYNLDLGQRYVRYLSSHELVGGDLIRLLVCYNAGLGHYAHWATSVRHEDDPLLFIESIPNAETRAYVPHVLTNTWLFAARLHLPTPSLDELAAGQWPRFHPLQERPEPAEQHRSPSPHRSRVHGPH